MAKQLAKSVGDRDLDSGATVLAHTVYATDEAYGGPGPLDIAVSGLDGTGETTLTLTATRDTVVYGDPITLTVPDSVTAKRWTIDLPELTAGDWSFALGSDNSSDTAVTVTATLSDPDGTADDADLVAHITDPSGAERFEGADPTITGTIAAGTADESIGGESMVVESGEAISVEHAASNFDHDGPFSVSVVMTKPSLSAFGVHVSRMENSGNYRGWAITNSTNRNKIAVLLQNTASVRIALESAQELILTTPRRFAFTYDGSGEAAGVKCYLDGRPVAMVVTSDNLDSNTIQSSAELTIGGRDGTASSAGASITYDDVRVWSRELTPAEVLAQSPAVLVTQGDWTLSQASLNRRVIGSYDWLGRADAHLHSSGLAARAFRASTGHDSSLAADIHFQLSGDRGKTWGDLDETLGGESVTGLPITVQNSTESPHDVVIGEAPNGDWLAFVSYYDGARHGTHVWRSPIANLGRVWTDEGQIAVGSLDDEINGGGGQACVAWGRLFLAVWIDNTPADADGPHYTSILVSDDNGATWETFADVSDTDENTGEPGLCYDSKRDVLRLVCKDNASNVQTFDTEIEQDGTQRTLREIQSSVGAIQRPKLYEWRPGVILLSGREDTATERHVLYLSRGAGGWSDKCYMSTYSQTDTGYGSVLFDGSTVRVTTYTGDLSRASLVDYELFYGGPLPEEAGYDHLATRATVATAQADLDAQIDALPTLAETQTEHTTTRANVIAQIDAHDTAQDALHAATQALITALTIPTASDIAAAVELAILAEDDGRAILQAVADQIANDWVQGDPSPLAIVAAMKADATIAQMISRIDAAVTTRGSQVDLAGLATIVGAIQDGLATQGTANNVAASVVASGSDLLLTVRLYGGNNIESYGYYVSTLDRATNVTTPAVPTTISSVSDTEDQQTLAGLSDWASERLAIYISGTDDSDEAFSGTFIHDPSTETLAAVGGLTPTSLAILQFDIDGSFLFELPRRTGSVTTAKDSIRLQLDTERPRFAFDVRPITAAKPSSVTSVEVLDSEGEATTDLVVADEEDSTNCGVRDYLVMSKVNNVVESGTYTVRMTFVTLDSSTLVVQGDVVIP